MFPCLEQLNVCLAWRIDPVDYAIERTQYQLRLTKQLILIFLSDKNIGNWKETCQLEIINAYFIQITVSKQIMKTRLKEDNMVGRKIE